MGHLKISSDVRHLKFKGVYEHQRKIRDTRPRVVESQTFYDTAEKIWESNVLPENFFHDQKRDMTSSVT